MTRLELLERMEKRSGDLLDDFLELRGSEKGSDEYSQYLHLAFDHCQWMYRWLSSGSRKEQDANRRCHVVQITDRPPVS